MGALAGKWRAGILRRSARPHRRHNGCISSPIGHIVPGDSACASGRRQCEVLYARFWVFRVLFAAGGVAGWLHLANCPNGG